jgi:hypothetical protein
VTTSTEVERDLVHVLGYAAALMQDDRHSLAEAYCALRALAASDDVPLHLRVILKKNVSAVRRIVSVRNRALWLSTIGDVPEAALILDVAMSLLCAECAPCEMRGLDAWRPVHTRLLSLLVRTQDQIVRRWRRDA